MSSTRSSSLDHAKAVGTAARDFSGMVRRMIISRSTDSIWQVTGHDLAAIGGEVETHDAENFASGIGYAARPASSDDGGDVEAIVAFPSGGAASPIIIAARQEAVRVQLAGDLDSDETQLHGAIGAGGTIIRIMRNGTVEIRSHGGTAQRLLTVDDGDNLVAAIRDAVPGASDGGAALQTSILANLSGWPSGTSVLKGE